MTTRTLIAGSLAILMFLAFGCGDDSGNGGSSDGSVDADTTDSRVDGSGWADSNVPGNNPNAPDLPSDDLAGGNVASTGTCAQQGLDELCRRRDLVPVKDSEAFIEQDGWSQPETVIFHDTVTGAEIIRLTDDPAGNIHHCHINRSTFNADGSYVSFGSPRCWPDYYCPDQYRYITKIWGHGPHIIEVPRQHMLWVGPYEAWDPEDPNVFYFVNHEDRNGLYRVSVDDGSFNTEQIMELSHPERRKHIFANVAPDGTLVFKTTNLENEPVYVYVWHPDRPEELITFDLGLGIDHPDHDPNEEWHVHDFTHRRNAQNTVVFNYGPQGSSGEPLFFELASDGSGEYRVSYAPNEDTYCPVPYYSHPAWNSDGTLVVFNGTAEKYVDGTNPDNSPLWTWNDSEWGGYVHQVSSFDPTDDYATSTLSAKVAELSLRIVHYAWDSYDSRWIHGAGSHDADPRSALYRMAADGSLTEVLAFTHSRSWCGGSCDYCSLPRPAQSPDGTKVLYTSDMLQHGENMEDLYLVVHRYPYAPVWLGLSTPDALELTWRFHEALSREIAGVRVMRSEDVSPPVFIDISGFIRQDSFSDSNIQLADNESVLYAVTSIESSGIESRSLSRVIRVTRSGSTYRVDQESPYGTIGFDTEAPSAPTGLAAQLQGTMGILLSWTPPPELDVRVYHIYASPGSDPETNQAYRVASMPASHPTYIDWSSSTGQLNYAVTAEDFQGNESSPARAIYSP